MPVLMIEPVADALRTQLQTYLPAKIAALQPAFVPLLPMPVPVEYVFAEKATFIKGYPVVQIVQLDTPIANEDLRWQDHIHHLEVGLFVQAAVEEELARLLDRYTRCVLETLIERRKAGAFLAGIPPFDLQLKGETITYSSTLPQNGQFVRAVFLPLRATRRDVERH